MSFRSKMEAVLYNPIGMNDRVIIELYWEHYQNRQLLNLYTDMLYQN